MLIIRDSQLHVFEQQSLARFCQDTTQYLREEYPDACAELGDAELERLIQGTLVEARSRGLETRGALVIYIELTFVFGKGFALSPDRRWAEKILVNPGLPDYGKMRMIRERLMALTEGLVMRRHVPEPGEEG